jgi:hypothetical protein
MVEWLIFGKSPLYTKLALHLCSNDVVMLIKPIILDQMIKPYEGQQSKEVKYRHPWWPSTDPRRPSMPASLHHPI